MCTVTLSYDQNNALARRKLAALLATRIRLSRCVPLAVILTICSMSFMISCVGAEDNAVEMTRDRDGGMALRDRILAFFDSNDQYDTKSYYKYFDDVSEGELFFLELTQGLDIEKQYTGTVVIWTAISSSQDTVRLTMQLQPTIEEHLGVIEFILKSEPHTSR